jgi:hypothetical protein
MRTAPGVIVARELAVIRRAFERAARAVEQAADPEAGFTAADQLVTALRDLAKDEGMNLVARAAARLRTARRYSLAELARAVDVSKSMAAYWDRRARKG